MRFITLGDRQSPAVLFFHAMGVTGESSRPVAEYLQDRFFCILPTSTVYCSGQRYTGKENEVRQVEDFLREQGVERLALVVASSKGTRRVMTPFLYLAIKSLYWTKGGTLKKILWCDDESIKPYFIAAGKALRYGGLRRQLADSLEDKPLPPLPEEQQRRTYFAFGSAEDHYKYRAAVMEAYPQGHFPVFQGYDHMQYQIRDPRGFSQMLASLIERGDIPDLPFVRK